MYHFELPSDASPDAAKLVDARLRQWCLHPSRYSMAQDVVLREHDLRLQHLRFLFEVRLRGLQYTWL
jgi:hypothetical protein